MKKLKIGIVTLIAGFLSLVLTVRGDVTASPGLTVSPPATIQPSATSQTAPAATATPDTATSPNPSTSSNGYSTMFKPIPLAIGDPKVVPLPLATDTPKIRLLGGTNGATSPETTR